MKALMKWIGLVTIYVSMGISSTCLAITISDTNAGSLDGTDVGMVDTFIAEDDKQGNPTAEEAWVNTVLGTTGITWTVKTGDVAYFSTDVEDVYSFQLSAAAIAADYFIVKNAQKIALFANLEDFMWGVFDSGDLSEDMNIATEDFEISHVTQFNGGPDFDVPAPAVLGVMAIGLLGVGFATRRKRT